jgi:hypothetical protein
MQLQPWLLTYTDRGVLRLMFPTNQAKIYIYFDEIQCSGNSICVSEKPVPTGLCVWKPNAELIFCTKMYKVSSPLCGGTCSSVLQIGVALKCWSDEEPKVYLYVTCIALLSQWSRAHKKCRDFLSQWFLAPAKSLRERRLPLAVVSRARKVSIRLKAYGDVVGGRNCTPMGKSLAWKSYPTCAEKWTWSYWWSLSVSVSEVED